MKQSQKPLLILAGLYILFGLIDVLTPHRQNEAPPLTLLWYFGIAICLFSWCKYDAVERNVKTGSSPLLVGLIAPLGVPIYFFRTYPFFKACLAIIKAVLFFIVTTLIYSGVADFGKSFLLTP